MTRNPLLLTCALAAASLPGTVLAQQGAPPEIEEEAVLAGEQEEAQTHFAAGRNHFERGHYEQALVEFEAAYELSERPALLYNLYLTHERLGRLQEAADHLERYLAHAGERRELLAARLESIRERLEEQRRSAEEAAADEESEEDEAVAPPPLRDDGGGAPVAAIASFAVGGAGLVAFGLFATLSIMEDADLAETCGADAGSYCTDDDVSTLGTYNLLADIGLGVAAVGAALGLVFLLTADGDDAGEVTVAPWLGPGLGGAAGRVRF